MPCLFLVSCIKGRRIFKKKSVKPDPISAKLCPLTRVKWKDFWPFSFTFQEHIPIQFGGNVWKKLDVVLKTSTVVIMYSIFNISTSSRFRTVPYGWCGPSEHAAVAVAVVENGNRPLFSYSRQYSVILAIIQLFSPCVFVQCYSVILALCFVQSAVYILSRPSVPGKVNFRNLLEHILISKANDSAKIKTKQKIAQLACCRCGSLRRNLK